MVAKNQQLRDGHAEVANEMVRVLERQNAVWDRAESGLDRMQARIDRRRHNMREYLAELKVDIRDAKRENSEVSERLRSRVDALTDASAS